MTRHSWEYKRDRGEHFRLLDRRMRAKSMGVRPRRQWTRLEELQPDESDGAAALLEGVVPIDQLAEVCRRGRLVGYVATSGLASGCHAWCADFTHLGRFFSRSDAIAAVVATAKGVR